MAKGLLARKLGMTQVFDEEGKMIPVTILRAGPCSVVQLKTEEKESYTAVQLGFEPIRAKLLNKPALGHFEKKGLTPFRIIREFRDTDLELEIGQVLKADIFEVGQTVKITGISKGKGFQGVMKRYGFGGGRATHGSHFKRAPGSLGATSTPSRVFKGKKLPGHTGVKKSTIMSSKIVKIDSEQDLLLVKGPVPGPRTALIRIEAI